MVATKEKDIVIEDVEEEGVLIEDSREGVEQPSGDNIRLLPEQEATQKAAKIDPAEANIILDAIFTRGVYEEEAVLPLGHKCVFATRSTRQAKEILARMEEDNPSRMPRYQQLYGLYCLVASLRSLDGKVMPGSFEEKIKIIDLWAGPLADILIDALIKFDDKVAAAYTTEQAKN